MNELRVKSCGCPLIGQAPLKCQVLVRNLKSCCLISYLPSFYDYSRPKTATPWAEDPGLFLRSFHQQHLRPQPCLGGHQRKSFSSYTYFHLEKLLMANQLQIELLSFKSKAALKSRQLMRPLALVSCIANRSLMSKVRP